MMLLAETDWEKVAYIMAPVLMALIALVGTYLEILRRGQNTIVAEQAVQKKDLAANTALTTEVKKEANGLTDSFRQLENKAGIAQGKAEVLQDMKDERDFDDAVAKAAAVQPVVAPATAATSPIEIKIVNPPEEPVPTIATKKPSV